MPEEEPKVVDLERVEKQFTALEKAGGAMQQIKTQYQTAMMVQRPRQLSVVLANVLEEARMAGKAFYYSWPVTNKKTGKVTIVEGGSIGLALAMAREWQNAAIEIGMQETHTHWNFTAHFIDLERGFTITRVYRQKIPAVTLGDYGVDRTQDMEFQKAQSKALRNVIFAGVPRWMQIKAREEAKQAEINGVEKEGVEVGKARMVSYFKGIGVSFGMIEDVIGKKLELFTAEDVATLRNFAHQIKEREATVEQLFGKAKDAKPADEPAKPAPASKPRGKPEQPELPVNDDARIRGRFEMLTKEVRTELLNSYQAEKLDEILSGDQETKAAFAREIESRLRKP